MRSFSLACVAALTLAAGSASAAEAPSQVVSTRVPYGDLDLSTNTGANAMVARLHAAASSLCAQPNTPVLPHASAEAWRCRGRTLARASYQLGAPMVAARLEMEMPRLASR